ncbi:TetR family transcriptional regulator C-terminal domain-containing protein [Pseudomonas citronellolis]|nr:TetR family transcriptional regulator C-terminal domain-containing protein [Pseudomonas citronellolis]
MRRRKVQGTRPRLPAQLDGRGLIATADPQHLLLFLWSATQAHTHFGWQASLITGKARPAEADYRAVAESVSRLVLGALAVEGGRGRLRPFPL